MIPVLLLCSLLAAVNFEKTGTFLDAKPGDSLIRLKLPTEVGRTYDRATLDFTMHIGDFQPVFNSIISLNRPSSTNFFAVQIRADKSKTLIDRMDHTQYGEVAPWKPNADYRVHIVYDAVRGMITFEAAGVGHEFKQRFETEIRNREIVDPGTGMMVVFGLDKVYDKAYFPPLGWRFSDLKVQLQ